MLRQKIRKIVNEVFTCISDMLSRTTSFFKPLKNRYMAFSSTKYGRLIRADKPHVYCLLFLPTWSAAVLANSDYNVLLVIAFCIVFFIGSIMMRSIGCIINDIIDKDIDIKVTRTKNRPVASGEISVKKALIVAGIMLLCTTVMLLFLPRESIIVCCIAAIMTCLYPYSKKFTYFPQVILGLTFNTGVPIAWFCFTDSFMWQLFTLYMSFAILTVAYDTIYACQDIEDDIKNNIKSLPVYLRKTNRDIKFVIWQLYKISVTCLGIVGLGMNMGLLFYITLVVAVYILYNDLELCDINDTNACAKHFRKTIVTYLLLVFLGVLAGK